MTKPWLTDFSWTSVVEINEALCAQKNALHRATSDGYEQTKARWEDNFKKESTLTEAVELCFQCHRLAPFCNYNGNTFVAIIRNVINSLRELTPEEQALARSLPATSLLARNNLEKIAHFRN